MKFYIYSFRITNSNTFAGLRKIGYTGKSNPQSRVWEWENDTGFKFNLVNSWVFHCENRTEIEKIERAIQRKFTNVTDLPNIFGREWYRNATDYDIDRVVKKYQEKNRLFNVTKLSPTAVDQRIRALRSTEPRPVQRRVTAKQRVFRKSKNSKKTILVSLIALVLLIAYTTKKSASSDQNSFENVDPTNTKYSVTERSPSNNTFKDLINIQEEQFIDHQYKMIKTDSTIKGDTTVSAQNFERTDSLNNLEGNHKLELSLSSDETNESARKMAREKRKNERRAKRQAKKEARKSSKVNK